MYRPFYPAPVVFEDTPGGYYLLNDLPIVASLALIAGALLLVFERGA